MPEEKRSRQRKRPSPKKIRSSGFNEQEVEHLLTCIDDLLPIGPDAWERVLDNHAAMFGANGRDTQSIRRKFNKLVKTAIPTGDPNCPPNVRWAKRIYRKIEEKMDAAGSVEDDDVGFPPPDDNVGRVAVPVTVDAMATMTSPSLCQNLISKYTTGGDSTTPSSSSRRQRAAAANGAPATDPLATMLMTKMLAEGDKKKELEKERKRERRERWEDNAERREEKQRNHMMTMMMMKMMQTMFPDTSSGTTTNLPNNSRGRAESKSSSSSSSSESDSKMQATTDKQQM
jgi:hypothetical protein